MSRESNSSPLSHIRASWWAGLLLFAASVSSLSAQQVQFPGIQYARGQDISPTFDGWERNPDGTFSMYFGYFNRNSEEEVDVPIGPQNTFDLGNGDQGQPTHFLTDSNRGRKWWVFAVTVPKDWPNDKRLVWTLTSNGRTNQAKGWLKPEFEVVKEGILLSDYRNRVSAGAGSGFKPPISIVGGPAQTITLPAAATLTATATAMSAGTCVPDASGRCATGVDLKRFQIRWIVYRGAGKVQFDPAISRSVDGKPITSATKVTFSAPGNYRLRATATDGSSFTNYDVDVKVNPSTSAEKAY